MLKMYSLSVFTSLEDKKFYTEQWNSDAVKFIFGTLFFFYNYSLRLYFLFNVLAEIETKHTEDKFNHTFYW